MEEALSFDDVLLAPKYSDIKSRNDVDIRSQLDEEIILDIPVIASPMDTIVDTDMVCEMVKAGGLAVVHRYNTIEQQSAIIKCAINLLEDQYPFRPLAAAIGVTGDYMERARELVSLGVEILVIDVAHGHHILVKEALKNLRKELDYMAHIMAGNVATAEGYKDLVMWGADSVRVGIGGGCFVPGAKVETLCGIKNIQEIQIGDSVKTHTGNFKEVVDVLQFDHQNEIYSINNIDCTPNHEFYVIKKVDQSYVNEDNIHEYARWVSAEELDEEEYLLIELG
jgi:IMP dehydrogenase/GMP reductase